jgi:hypothetical protein
MPGPHWLTKTVDNKQTAECANCRQQITRTVADAWLAAAANRPPRLTDWVDGGDNRYCPDGGWVKHQPGPVTVPAQ